MRPTLLTLAAALMALSCSREPLPEPKAATPEEAFKLYTDFARARNAEGVWAMYTDRMRTIFGAQLQIMRSKDSDERFKERLGLDKQDLEGLKPHEAFVKLMETNPRLEENVGAATVDHVERQGPDQTLVFTRNGERECAYPFRKDADAWKLDGPGQCKAAGQSWHVGGWKKKDDQPEKAK